MNARLPLAALFVVLYILFMDLQNLHVKTIRPVAIARTDFSEKFGIPRQAGLVPELRARIELLPEYAQAEAVRELDSFSHVWLVWGFSANESAAPAAGTDAPVANAGLSAHKATVRPPRLGGKTRVGVFASRSPFRPNGLGISVVALEKIEREGGIVLHVRGADLLDGTPVYDIKPYIPLCDCVPAAGEGYTAQTKRHKLEVICEPRLLEALPQEKRTALLGLLAEDPRQTYFQEPTRVYGLSFAGFNVKFRVDGCSLWVVGIARNNS